MIAGRLLRTRARRWTALAVVVLLVAVVVVAVWPRSGPPPVLAQDERIAVPGGPGVAGTVTLDAGLYLPDSVPAPAVIVAHGFGGSRASVDADAQRLARAGFVVLAYSARGFGASTGQIGLDSLDYEVADARALVDWLSRRPEVRQDAPGDPRVGVTGGSYGGALSLMLAGTDPRVDAVAAVATWNDLTQALFPNNAAVTGSSGEPASEPGSGAGSGAATPADIPARPDGVFKRSWAAALMSSVISGSGLPSLGAAGSFGSGNGGAGAGSGDGSPGGAPGSDDGNPGGTPGSDDGNPGGTPGSDDGNPSGTPGSDDGNPGGAPGSGVPGAGPAAAGCGRMMLSLCAAYVQVAQTGRLTPAMQRLLANSSPARVADRITAPTLLVQGENDTLFGLDQADANARAIAGNGTTVAVSWYAGGHNGGGLDTATQDRVTGWLQHYLSGTGPVPADAFRYTVAGPPTDSGRARNRTLQLDGYPGLGEPPVPRTAVPLSGPAQTVINPPGGLPAAISSLPGVGSLGAGALGALS
ncbi:MAG TPA: alpha/beta fold hydrolase, partial [Nakamurella sp.]|nr:alpha/beta fold hydrolase [Nakamurella sp.]